MTLRLVLKGSLYYIILKNNYNIYNSYGLSEDNESN